MVDYLIRDAVVAYCETQGLDTTAYFDFVTAMRLPPGNRLLKTVSEKLIDDYQRASKFKWLADEAELQAELIILKNIVEALKPLKGHSKKIKGSVTDFPLAANLISDTNNDEFIANIYAALKIYLLRLSRHQSTSSVMKSNTLDNIATKSRQKFAHVIRQNFVMNDVYANKQSFVDLLYSIHEDSKTFPKNFVEWIANQNIPKSVTRAPISPVIQVAGESYAEQKTVLYSANPIEIEENLIFRQSRILKIQTATELDDDERIHEILEYQVDSEIPVSYETVEQSLIYGSRLCTQERMLLSLRSNVFTDFELKLFIEGCNKHLQSANEQVSIASALLQLILLTARNMQQLKSFLLSNKLPAQTEGIDLKHEFWRRKSIEMPKAVKPEMDCNLLKPHQEFVDLPLPTKLMQKLKSCAVDNNTIGDLMRRSKVAEPFLLDTLALIMEVIPRRGTLAQVRSSLFQKLALEYDPGFASLLLATTEYITPTPLYYKSAKLSTLHQSYKTALEKLDFEVSESANLENHQITGSHLAIDDQALSKFFLTKYRKLEQKAEELNNEQSAINFFNELTHYTILILLASTGHRTRNEFQFEPSLYNAELNLLLLADKVQFDDSAIRFVPLSDVAHSSMIEYGKVARRIATYISNRELKVSLVRKSNWQESTLSEPFFSILTNSNSRGVTSNDIKNYLAVENLYLPLNFFRHRLCSTLSKFDGGDAINWMLGHIGVGEHPLGLTSTLTLSDISQCKKIINDSIEPLAIQIYKALPARGLPSNEYQGETTSFIPSNLNLQKMTFKQRLKWVLGIFKKFRQTLEDGQSVLDYIDEFTIYSIEKAMALQCRVDSYACMRLINRTIERYRKDGVIPDQQTWRMPFYEPSSLLSPTFFCESKTVIKLREQLSKRLMGLANTLNSQQALFEIVLSVICQSARHFKNEGFVSALQHERFTIGGLHFFDYPFEHSKKRLYLDALTVGLLHRFPAFQEQKFSETKFLSFLKKTLKDVGIMPKPEVLRSISAFSYWLAFNDVQPQEPGILRSMRLNALQSKPLSHLALARLLTPKVLNLIQPMLEKPKQSANYNLRKTNMTSKAFVERKFFDQLMKNVSSRLSKNEAGQTIKNVLRQIWQEYVGAKSSKISDLIAASSHLSDAAIATLIFMTDVSKRKGRGGRKNISYRTLTTNFSKVCVPILDIAQDQKFFVFDEDELEDFYTQVLDVRELQTRPRHTEMLKDLHKCVEKHFYLADVNWYEIEPNIPADSQQRQANVIVQSDYEKALYLLITDPFSNERERVIQAAILIFSYRLGLRRAEIKYRLQREVDSPDNLLYVYSNYLYRLKTVNANRRIPKQLLLNDQEQEIIKSLIIIAKRSHDNSRGRVFNISDPEFAKRCARVTESLVCVTEDNEVRLHDCRHSFATFLCLAGIVQEYSLLYSQVKAWCRQKPEYFKLKWLQTTVGKTQFQAHKYLNTLAIAIGHSTPLTTLTHYVHELDLHHLDMQSMYREHYSHILQQDFAKWLDTQNVNARKIVSRSTNLAQISLMQRIINSSWRLPITLELRERSDMFLSAQKLHHSSYEEWLIKLGDFRKLASAPDPDFNKNNSLMLELFELFRERELKAPIDICTSFGSIRANRHIRSRVMHALSSRDLPEHLEFFAHYEVDELVRLSSVVLDSYYGNNGYFISERKFADIKTFEKFGLIFAAKCKQEVNSRVSKEIGTVGYVMKCKTDISDSLFVAAIIIQLNYR
uniref:hypothetical protein n=1 Tax=Rheinheimera sp. TaxID=1869214 RepID=UPI004048AA36